MKKIYWVFSAILPFVASCQQPDDVKSTTESAKTGEVKPGIALKIANNFSTYVSVLNDQQTHL